MARPKASVDPGQSRMDIALTADGRPVLFTWYRGHKFADWITQEGFARAEADGVLSWDAEGNPIIREGPGEVDSPHADP